jgi:hypothetical protein
MGAGFGPDGTVVCNDPSVPDFDDPGHKELCHFEKFAEIYCDYEALEQQFAAYNLGGVANYFVLNVPTNPTNADYAGNAALESVATLINATYTYLFVMTENCYKQSGNTQYETFMFGIHKTMIFILSSLCGDIQGLTFEKDGKAYIGSAPFENYSFGLMSSPKSQLNTLFNSAVALYPTISYLQQRYEDLPDVPLN